jgi:GT2 family glycosyltransferase
MTKRASVVVVTWNNVEIIRHCLNSLLGLSREHGLEVIVVDNASSDGTPDVVQHEFPQATLIRNAENFGFARGNNIGIEASTGRYVCLINSDVIVTEGCLEELLQYMEAHPDIGVVGPKMILPDGSVGRSCMGFPTIANWLWRALALDLFFRTSRRFGAYLMPYFQYTCTTDVEVLTGWFWVVRRLAMKEVGLLDERFFMYAEDIDWCKRFKDAGWRVVFYPHASAVHYCAASSSRAPTRFYIEMRRANLQYCQRHHNRSSVGCFWLISVLHELVRALGYCALYLLLSRSRPDSGFKARRSRDCFLWLLGWRFAWDVKVKV